jgi:RNA polymerase sigma factor, sigma-70 family
MDMPPEQQGETSDEALLRLYAQGDGRAARILTARLSPLVYGLAMKLLQDQAEAEDVTQEAMLRLWKNAALWRAGEARISTWLYRVCSNLCMDRLRRRRAIGLDEIAEPRDDSPDAASRMQLDQRVAALYKALEDLPERQRVAVVLRHIEGLANPEIAEILETTVEAVESLLSRGRRTLKALLGSRREELGFEE